MRAVLSSSSVCHSSEGLPPLRLDHCLRRIQDAERALLDVKEVLGTFSRSKERCELVDLDEHQGSFGAELPQAKHGLPPSPSGGRTMDRLADEVGSTGRGVGTQRLDAQRLEGNSATGTLSRGSEAGGFGGQRLVVEGPPRLLPAESEADLSVEDQWLHHINKQAKERIIDQVVLRALCDGSKDYSYLQEGTLPEPEHLFQERTLLGGFALQRAWRNVWMPILHPHARLRLCWLILGLIFIIYEAFSIPMYMCFKVNATGGWFVIASVVVTYFLMDIALNFIVGYADKAGIVVLEPQRIAKRYIRTWFVLDVVASVPLEWLSAEDTAPSGIRLIRFLRIVRLVRLMRILKMRSLMSRVEEIVEGNEMAQFATGLIYLLASLAVTTHWAACIWWAVGSEQRPEASWTDSYKNAYPDLAERYVWSLYFTLTTMTTVGYGDIVPLNLDEAIFACFLLPVASVMFATLMGNLTDLITNLNERGRRRKRKKIMLHRYLTWRKVPPTLRAQIRQCFLFLWDTQEDFQAYEEDVKASLPSVLREELCLHFYGRLLYKAPFLKWMRDYPVCMRSLSSMLKTIFLERGDFLFKVGDLHTQIFMLNEGTVYLSLNQCLVHAEPSVKPPKLPQVKSPTGKAGQAKDRERDSVLPQEREGRSGSKESPTVAHNPQRKLTRSNTIIAIKVVPEAVSLRVSSVQSRLAEIRRSPQRQQAPKGAYNIFDPPAFEAAHALLQAQDLRTKHLVLRLQRLWRKRNGRVLGVPAARTIAGGFLQRSPDRAFSAPPLGSSSVGLRKGWTVSETPRDAAWRLMNMRSHNVKAPAYLGESCLWHPVEEWGTARATQRFTYNARCEARSEVVLLPRAAVLTILRCYSPWLPSRFEHFRKRVLDGIGDLIESREYVPPQQMSNVWQMTQPSPKRSHSKTATAPLLRMIVPAVIEESQKGEGEGPPSYDGSFDGS